MVYKSRGFSSEAKVRQIIVNSSVAFVLILAIVLLMDSIFLRSSEIRRRNTIDRISLENFVIKLENETPANYYDSHVDEFCNKCDFEFYEAFLPTISCCHSGTAAFITGGLNEGALADLILRKCSSPLHGFEIQKGLFEMLVLKYSKLLSRVTVNNLGLSNINSDAPMTYVDGGEGTGLFTNFRNTSKWDGITTIRTTRIDDYITQNKIQEVCMVLIDVEGHESEALQGLSLHENAESTPILVYELGGTWQDSRHTSSWTQADAALYLANLGYRLFLIGSSSLLEVDDLFFRQSRTLDEGFGNFVQGNLLAIHRSRLLF